MENQYITLEQWRTLVAVVDSGGYAQAADILHKSQSSVTYAVQKIEALLGVKAFEIQGRRAMLTPTGQFLYRRARTLLEESNALERAARRLSAGWEAEIRIAAEIIFPSWLMLQCLQQFGEESPHTRIELIESVLGGTAEALLEGRVDLAIANSVPPGFLGAPLMRVRFIPVASPRHPLHQLGRELTAEDLQKHRHLVVRESGVRRDAKVIIDAAQRWTVSQSATSIEAAKLGYGFAWFPEEKIRDELRAGSLKPLPVRDGGERFTELYMIVADPDSAGPGTRRLAEIIRDAIPGACQKVAQEAFQPPPGA
ncbi:MAG TPA: LysR family transcriptional regulator [Noviherbaspirillum sp.]|jgi:DNA-binding transcriptional LysR family regulator|uniref:LysR family transcriptional regulator n=1 Tax=Noviherbaspirillum sp. TaxID=1926288 RepID=UPI002F946AA3